MTGRVSSHRRWMLRDIPRTYVLLVWLAFAVAHLIYSNDWRPSGWSALRRSRFRREAVGAGGRTV